MAETQKQKPTLQVLNLALTMHPSHPWSINSPSCPVISLTCTLCSTIKRLLNTKAILLLSSQFLSLSSFQPPPYFFILNSSSISLAHMTVCHYIPSSSSLKIHPSLKIFLTSAREVEVLSTSNPANGHTQQTLPSTFTALLITPTIKTWSWQDNTEKSQRFQGAGLSNDHKVSTDVWQKLGVVLQGMEKIKYLHYSCKVKMNQEASRPTGRKK